MYCVIVSRPGNMPVVRANRLNTIVAAAEKMVAVANTIVQDHEAASPLNRAGWRWSIPGDKPDRTIVVVLTTLKGRHGSLGHDHKTYTITLGRVW